MEKLTTTETTDGFWQDCINDKGLKIDILPNKIYPVHYTGRNKNNKARMTGNFNNALSKKKNINFSTNKTNNKTSSRTIDHSFLSKIYKNHPLLKEKDKEKKYLELRKKNAMRRCLGLYAYGVEVKKAKMLNDENNKKERMKDEISPCTFRPKICKYSKAKMTRYVQPEFYKKNKIKNHDNILSNGDYKIDTISSNDHYNGFTSKNIKNKKIKKMNHSIDNNNEYDSNDTDECTFKPKINKKDIKKLFGKSKSMANEKDNAEFILRYTKAREEYMIKKLKKISSKDDSYDATLYTLAQRLNTNNYRNAPVINYDEKYKKNNNKKANLSMNDFKDYTIENKKNIPIEKSVINDLRNDLLEINLNEEE